MGNVCLHSIPHGLQTEEERLQKKRYKNVLVSDVFGGGLHRKLVVAPLQTWPSSSPLE